MYAGIGDCWEMFHDFEVEVLDGKGRGQKRGMGDEDRREVPVGKVADYLVEI